MTDPERAKVVNFLIKEGISTKDSIIKMRTSDRLGFDMICESIRRMGLEKCRKVAELLGKEPFGRALMDKRADLLLIYSRDAPVSSREEYISVVRKPPLMEGFVREFFDSQPKKEAKTVFQKSAKDLKAAAEKAITQEPRLPSETVERNWQRLLESKAQYGDVLKYLVENGVATKERLVELSNLRPWAFDEVCGAIDKMGLNNFRKLQELLGKSAFAKAFSEKPGYFGEFIKSVHYSYRISGLESRERILKTHYYECSDTLFKEWLCRVFDWQPSEKKATPKTVFQENAAGMMAAGKEGEKPVAQKTPEPKPVANAPKLVVHAPVLSDKDKKILRETTEEAASAESLRRKLEIFDAGLKRLEGNDARALLWMRKAEILIEGKRFEEAEAALTSALKLNPGFAHAILLRAQIREKLGDSEGAWMDSKTYAAINSDKKSKEKKSIENLNLTSDEIRSGVRRRRFWIEWGLVRRMTTLDEIKTVIITGALSGPNDGIYTAEFDGRVVEFRACLDPSVTDPDKRRQIKVLGFQKEMRMDDDDEGAWMDSKTGVEKGRAAGVEAKKAEEKAYVHPGTAKAIELVRDDKTAVIEQASAEQIYRDIMSLIAQPETCKNYLNSDMKPFESQEEVIVALTRKLAKQVAFDLICSFNVPNDKSAKADRDAVADVVMPILRAHFRKEIERKPGGKAQKAPAGDGELEIVDEILKNLDESHLLEIVRRTNPFKTGKTPSEYFKKEAHVPIAQLANCVADELCKGHGLPGRKGEDWQQWRHLAEGLEPLLLKLSENEWEAAERNGAKSADEKKLSKEEMGREVRMEAEAGKVLNAIKSNKIDLPFLARSRPFVFNALVSACEGCKLPDSPGTRESLAELARGVADSISKGWGSVSMDSYDGRKLRELLTERLKPMLIELVEEEAKVLKALEDPAVKKALDRIWFEEAYVVAKASGENRYGPVERLYRDPGSCTLMDVGSAKNIGIALLAKQVANSLYVEAGGKPNAADMEAILKVIAKAVEPVLREHFEKKAE